MTSTTVTVIVVAWGDEPWIEESVRSALRSVDVDVDVVVVDNGDLTGAVDRLEGQAGVTVVRPGRNLGFAGGCNAGARVATGQLLTLLNADATVSPECLSRLSTVALRRGVGIATASIRLAHDPTLMNTAGNPMHYSGIVWAGGFGEPAKWHDREKVVATASGACLALRRSLWEELGGFDPAYFAYHEDTELSLRCHHRGLSVVYVPDAVAVHRYEFSRNSMKHYLIERNRLLTVLTSYERRTLFLLLPALAALELPLLSMAVAQGWGGAKVRSYVWLLRNSGRLRLRRAVLQRERCVSDRDLAQLLTGRIEPTNVQAVAGMALLNGASDAYWKLVRRAL